jgi:hypothetical protein
MRTLFVLVALLLGLPSSAFATWSVIAVDRETGRVVIASATCVNGDDMFLPGVQAVVVPGMGANKGSLSVMASSFYPRHLNDAGCVLRHSS